MLPSTWKTMIQHRDGQQNAVVVVSGLPRSGTSMMMKILQAGGLEIMTDNIRRADEDNPKGYYEFERVKALQEGDSAWIYQARGKAIKVISALLEYLPSELHYKVIFMVRNMDEILASQKQMLIRRGEPVDKVGDEALADYYSRHLESIKAWLAEQENIQVLYVHYNETIKDPRAHLAQVHRFLGGLLDLQAMLHAIDPKLYRQRQDGG